MVGGPAGTVGAEVVGARVGAVGLADGLAVGGAPLTEMNTSAKATAEIIIFRNLINQIVFLKR